MQSSILNTHVSCFANYDTPHSPVTVNLLTWLTSAKYKDKVEQIRSLPDKAARDALKATLPAITPGGIFTYRREDALMQYSGFIQFDIDLKDNKRILNYGPLRYTLGYITNVAYCGLSVSGQGYWGLIPVACPERHKEHFKAMEKAFKHLGITIDPAPKNIASLRGYSYDPNAYFNHTADVLHRTHTDKPPLPHTYPITTNDTRTRVERCINTITARGIDITTTYQQWLRIGLALAAEFGEAGRQYFHEVSRFYPKYSYTETDKKYTTLLRNHNNRVGIGTFFYLCGEVVR